MADDEGPTGELEALRRVAYSRGGTDDDRRRLAELEDAQRPASVEEIPVSEPDDLQVSPFEPDTALLEPEAPRRRAISLRHLVATAAVGLMAGAAITAGILMPSAQPSAVSPFPEPATALAIFDRPATDADDADNLLVPLDHVLPGGAEGAQLRWLGEVSGSTVYAAQGTLHGITTVCLIVQQQSESGASCADAGDFAIRGVRLATFGLDFRWGPQGTEMWFLEDPARAPTPNPANYLSGDRTMGS